MCENKKIGAGFGIMLFNNGKILLGKRHEDPAKAGSALHGEGTWTLPGGKLDFGEEFENGIKRELKEETDMDIDPADLKLISVANHIVEDAHFVTLCFMTEKFSGEPKIMEPDEITTWQWFDINELPKPMFFPSKIAIENYLNKKLYKSLND